VSSVEPRTGRAVECIAGAAPAAHYNILHLIERGTQNHTAQASVKNDLNQALAAGGAQAQLIPPYSPNWCFFLDIDGTLIDFAERPDAVVIDAALKSILRRLVEATGGAVALVSGRPIATVDRLFEPLRIAIGGQHGIERRDGAGNLHVHPVPAARLRHAVGELEQLAAQHPELVFENKGSTLAMHFRRAPRLAPRVEHVMHQLLEELGAGFELMTGKMLYEIKPGGTDKGTVIAEFMDESPFRERVPVFIGDDVTDEHGFELVNRRRGHSVKVGAGTSAAHWRLVDSKAVRAWLTAFAEKYTPRARH
jgi:trehalose 6-phosphate phosphatase